ncbi:Methyltransferase-like protein 7B [Halotydeus destructor]|nr:Methyltransferase-like protein 7B [Halotydeus destructor]
MDQLTSSAKRAFYHCCLIVPAAAIAIYWPVLLLVNHVKFIGDIYYAFTFVFSYYFVGEPIKPVKRVLFSTMKDISSSSAGLKVLEVGPGTGSNFAYFPPNTRLTTIELNPYLEQHFNDIKDQHPHIKLERSLIGSAENMAAVASNSLDIVVGTHVLCCIKDPLKALKEIHRVLVPGGRYYFLELVSHPDEPDNGTKRKLQAYYAPIWRTFSMGCKAGNQDIDRQLDEAGFYSIDRHAYEIPELPVTHNLVYFGTAAKSNNSKVSAD